MEEKQTNIMLNINNINNMPTEYPHYYPTQHSSTQETLLNHLQEVNFWQDEALSIFLEDKFKDKTHTKDLEAVILETQDLEKKIAALEEENRNKEKSIEEGSLSREDLLNKINELSFEIEELDKELNEEKDCNSKISKILQSFENPINLAKHIIDNFDHTTGVKLVSEVNFYLSFYFQMQSYLPPMMGNMNMGMPNMNFNMNTNSNSNSNINSNSAEQSISKNMGSNSYMNMNMLGIMNNSTYSKVNNMNNASNYDNKENNNLNLNINPMMMNNQYNPMFNPMMYGQFPFYNDMNNTMNNTMNNMMNGFNKNKE